MTNSAVTTGRLSQQSGVRRLELDDVRLTYVIDGAMGLLPHVFFPDVPSSYWPATLTPSIHGAAWPCPSAACSSNATAGRC